MFVALPSAHFRLENVASRLPVSLCPDCKQVSTQALLTSRVWASPAPLPSLSSQQTRGLPGFALCGPFLLCRSLPWKPVLSWFLFSHPTWLCRDSSYSFGCIGDLLPVSNWFSVKNVPHGDVFLMCLWRMVSFTSSYPTILRFLL